MIPYMTMMKPTHWLILILLSSIVLVDSLTLLYNVESFGAVPGGQTDAASAFQKAWTAACTSAYPATIYIPRGRFLLRSVAFAGPCRSSVTFLSDATLLAPPDYRSLGNLDYWIMFITVSRVSVIGGIYDAQGSGYWSCLASQQSCPTGANSLVFEWSSDIIVSGVTSLNSRQFHIGIVNCVNIAVRKVRLIAPSQSPNTDGIHIQSSTGVSIVNAGIKTGDDCISLGPGSKNVFIKKVACGPGHGISIGSLGNTAQEDGVQNVTVTSVVLTGTQNGVRIKSWERPSTGFARSIVFRNIVMKNVYNPIIIDQKYCPNSNNCLTQNSGVQISRVSYKDIRGTSATPVAISLVCSRTHPCWGISLQNINLSDPGQTATSYCENAGGSNAGIVVPKSCL